MAEDDNSTAMIPRTSERNSSLPIAPPVPSIPLPSYFASHSAACLACLHASPHGINSIKKSCSSLIRCATADLGTSREENKKPTNTHPSPSLTTDCSSYTPSYKRPNGGGHHHCQCSQSNRSSVKRTMMMMLCSRWAVAVLPAQSKSPSIAQYPCRSSAGDPRAHHPGPNGPSLFAAPGQPRSRGRDDTSKRMDVMDLHKHRSRAGEGRQERSIAKE
jgi:hypothetical protein